jgi:hypothetical protein
MPLGRWLIRPIITRFRPRSRLVLRRRTDFWTFRGATSLIIVARLIRFSTRFLPLLSIRTRNRVLLIAMALRE